MYGEYRKAKKNAEKDEREKKEKDRIKDEVEGYIKDTKLIKIPNNIIDIFNGESSFRMLSRIQIDQFKDYYDSIK
ncbi:hypothetical protein J6T66_00215 [bacterium]|nr:hypothetical protein [bacterium]